MTPAYLQDSRPDFAPFEIDCGTIPAFRYQGNLKSELAAGRIDGRHGRGASGRHADDPRAGGNDRHRAVRRLRAAGGLQLSRSHARFHRSGRRFRGSVQRPDPEGPHHQHAPRPRGQPGARVLRPARNDRTSCCGSAFRTRQRSGARRTSRSRPWKSTSIAPSRSCSAKRMVIAGGAAAACTLPTSRSATWAPTPLWAAACRLPPARPWVCATCKTAAWCVALPGMALTATAWFWNR